MCKPTGLLCYRYMIPVDITHRRIYIRMAVNHIQFKVDIYTSNYIRNHYLEYILTTGQGKDTTWAMYSHDWVMISISNWKVWRPSAIPIMKNINNVIKISYVFSNEKMNGHQSHRIVEYTGKPVHAVISIKQSPVLRGHIFLVKS